MKVLQNVVKLIIGIYGARIAWKSVYYSMVEYLYIRMDCI